MPARARFWRPPASPEIKALEQAPGRAVLRDRREFSLNTSITRSRADLLVQSVTDYAIFMLDPAGIVSSWNAGAERFKGYKADEIIGEHFSRFYTEEDRARGVPERALATSLSEGRFETEGWRVRKDGTRFWANVVIDPVRDEEGCHIGFAKITRDLSDRREAEEELRSSEERFRLLVQGVTDYAIYMLDPEGRVSSWNAGAERFKGYTADEIIGEHFSRFYPPDDRAAGVPQRALKTAAEEGRFEAEGWRARKDGSLFWAHVVIDPIRNDSGTLLGFTKITRDLTERKQAAEALEESREQFFQAQKMEAIGKLTGGVAHDFNNLLAAITGSLELAQRRYAEGKDPGQFIANAMHAARRGATLTQRLLSFARKQVLQLEPTDLVATIRETAELLSRTIGPQVAIETRFPLGLGKVLADRAQLELALMNLVVNARDAMPGGGTILLTIDQPPAEDGEEYVRLSVIDQGEGMDAETLARATEPFFTTKGIGKGTGLGLPMVQGMAEQCGGRFVIDSEPGKGTSAQIWLKPTAKAVPVSTDDTPLGTPATTRNLRVLAVDDDVTVLLNTVTLLEDMGHSVTEAHSGSEALGALEQAKFDVLLTDYAMPGMNGADLVQRARAIQPDIAAAVITGYAELPDGFQIAAPRLGKPFSDSELAAMIARLACESER
jgi:PAS domain S-box-containing protein